MVPIKELSEIPLVKVLVISSLLCFSIFPPFIWIYAVDNELFLEIDFWKLAFLGSGFGIVSLLFCSCLIIYAEIIIDESLNYDIGRETTVDSGFSKCLLAIIISQAFLWIRYNDNLSSDNSISYGLEDIAYLYYKDLLTFSGTLILGHFGFVVVYNWLKKRKGRKEAKVSAKQLPK